MTPSMWTVLLRWWEQWWMLAVWHSRTSWITWERASESNSTCLSGTAMNRLQISFWGPCLGVTQCHCVEFMGICENIMVICILMGWHKYSQNSFTREWQMGFLWCHGWKTQRLRKRRWKLALWLLEGPFVEQKYCSLLSLSHNPCQLWIFFYLLK